MKICKKCHQLKPLTEYSKKNAKNRPPGLQPRCKVCAAEDTRAWNKKNDVIEIEINNNGGHIDTALQIKNAIHECKAQVITCLNVAAHSAAGVVFLSGHSYKIGKYGSLLIHEGSTGYVGKPSDLRRHSEFQNAQLERVVRDVYEEILTPSEIEAVLNGLELILDDMELMKRLNKR